MKLKDHDGAGVEIDYIDGELVIDGWYDGNFMLMNTKRISLKDFVKALNIPDEDIKDLFLED